MSRGWAERVSEVELLAGPFYRATISARRVCGVPAGQTVGLTGEGMIMISELQRQIAGAVVAGTPVDAIEEALIDPAPLDEEHKSALWLYADALWNCRRDGTLAKSELAPIAS